MSKLLRFGVLFSCIWVLQGLSANEYTPQGSDQTYHSDLPLADGHDAFVQFEPGCENIDCCVEESAQAKKKRIPKILHHDRVERCRMVPQKYCVTLCKYETVCEEIEDCNGCKKKCFRQIPHYYQEERCRMVPQKYYRTVCRYETECCEVNDCKSWLNLQSTFDVDLGYRQDSLTCLINHYNPPGTFIVSDDLKIKKMQVWEAGIKGMCIARDTYMVKGFLYSGSIRHGDYTETVTGKSGNSSTLKFKVHRGQTVDFSVGSGLLLPLCAGIRVGPTLGWSYNAQKVKMKSDIKIFNGLEYNNRWQGAWLGADALISFCGFGLHAGYEYHIPEWNAQWLLKGKDIFGSAFSDVRHSNRGYGNVVFLDASTVRFGCMKFNCQLKYQYWKMRDGREHPKNGSFASVGSGANEVDKVRNATWQSFEVILGLGLAF